MAQSGTITENQTNYGTIKITITGITSGTNSPNFTLRGYPFTGGVVSGTFQTASVPTLQWQGSNDGGVTWINIGLAFTSGPASGSLSPFGEIYELYQLLVTGGDGGTSLSAIIIASSPRG